MTFGPWRLPAADALELSGTHGSVTLKLHTEAGWRSTHFARGEESWETNDVEPLPVLSRPGLRWTTLPNDLLTPGTSIRRVTEIDEEDRSGTRNANSLVHECTDALDLILRYAGDYYPWVQAVVRNLVALRATGDCVRTQSHKFSPGVLSMSVGQHRCGLAESLVHEATHQYFYIAARMGQVEDGTDQHFYYSSFRNALRPIYNILLAYHAFANVVVFYRTALRNGLAADPVSADIAKCRSAQVQAELQPLVEALHSTKGLTPLGRALWEPLEAQLQN